MRLAAAAAYFDTCPVYDGYTGQLLFKAQASTFLESSTEGSTAARRVISVAPTLTFPAHSVVMVLGQLILIGADNPDEWAGSTIRRAYWTKRVTDNFSVLTPSEAALSEAGTAAFGQKAYLRESLNLPTDSNLDAVWTVYLSKSLLPPAGYFLRSGTTLYRLRSSYQDIDGFTSCLADEVDEPVVNLQLVTGTTLDPVTDTYTAVSISTSGVVLDYIKAFTQQSQQDYKMQAGDLSLVVSGTLSANIGAGVELSVASGIYAGKWRVLNRFVEHDGLNLHIRRIS